MKFSIVTPSYRQFDYLGRCVRSVGDQVVDGGVEHIIQDGGGGEGLEEFMQRSSSMKNVEFIHEEDGGMYDAINRGFRRAEGGIISWLNCDEQYLPRTLEKVERWFDENPAKDILFGDVLLIDDAGDLLSYRKAIEPDRKHILSCFLPTYSAATFVRRRVIEEGGLLDDSYKAIADAVWIYDLLGKGFAAGVLNEPLAVFTQTGENLGQTEVSHLEHDAWRKAEGGCTSVQRKLLSLKHRFRKLLHGAYLPRTVNTRIFVSSSTSRQAVRKTIGGLWKTSN